MVEVEVTTELSSAPLGLHLGAQLSRQSFSLEKCSGGTNEEGKGLLSAGSWPPSHAFWKRLKGRQRSGTFRAGEKEILRCALTGRWWPGKVEVG